MGSCALPLNDLGLEGEMGGDFRLKKDDIDGLGTHEHAPRCHLGSAYWAEAPPFGVMLL
jgi:hypothetical protein